jgi:hypothetical protein
MSAENSTEEEGVPLDTSAVAHALQRDLYQRLGGKERLTIVFRLNETVRQLSMAGIRARHPEYDDNQVQRAYCRLVLGDQLVHALWPDRELVVP